jgi:hypothetical protein
MHISVDSWQVVSTTCQVNCVQSEPQSDLRKLHILYISVYSNRQCLATTVVLSRAAMSKVITAVERERR